MSEERLRVWAARLAAPVAFFVAAGVLIALVQGGLSSTDTGTEATPTATLSTPTETTPPAKTGRDGSPGRRRFYKVRSGDTLESIAARFDTTADHLSELNPGIDPLALSPGRKIRVT